MTIVNVALPDLGRRLKTSTKDLRWSVDGYNLVFAALVLTAGALIAVRFAMGAFAALIYPTTLSVKTNNVVTDGGERSRRWCR
ncbi:MAG: hypothetical protein QOF86_2911 [Baekduia sp.]|nr:hypothetical protein [Baekduia sp.]